MPGATRHAAAKTAGHDAGGKVDTFLGSLWRESLPLYGSGISCGDRPPAQRDAPKAIGIVGVGMRAGQSDKPSKAQGYYSGISKSSLSRLAKCRRRAIDLRANPRRVFWRKASWDSVDAARAGKWSKEAVPRGLLPPHCQGRKAVVGVHHRVPSRRTPGRRGNWRTFPLRPTSARYSDLR